MVVWKRDNEAGVAFTEVSDEAAPVVATYISSHRGLK
jgi:hypothetical protein